MSKFKRICIIMSIVVIIVPVVTYAYTFHKVKSFNNENTKQTYLNKELVKKDNNDNNKVEKVEKTQNVNTNQKEALNIKKEENLKTYKDVDGITNILLIGIDARNKNEKSRSDTMMILTIDNLHKTLKLTSLARDTLVNIPGRGYEKLTHSYVYGGEKLLLDTINKNFKLNIKNYAVVNFQSFIDIIDTLGGVEVNVEHTEIDHLNKVISVCYDFSNKVIEEEPIEYITSTGIQNLNGYQALAYARIRYNDSAFKRDERQREVLQNLTKKISQTSITNYPQLIKDVLTHVKVNISPGEIMKLALIAHKIGSYDMQQFQIPLAEYRNDAKVKFKENDILVIKWDKVKNLNKLHNFIYKEGQYFE